ncbi:MAG: RHS repeat protein [Lachnospiraceae bacterium]|nr:RHS repeat protein [Lachnospiraceae bacterium]
MNCLTSVTDAQGRTEQMTYDIAGRLTSCTSNSRLKFGCFIGRN